MTSLERLNFQLLHKIMLDIKMFHNKACKNGIDLLNRHGKNI